MNLSKCWAFKQTLCLLRIIYRWRHATGAVSGRNWTRCHAERNVIFSRTGRRARWCRRKKKKSCSPQVNLAHDRVKSWRTSQQRLMSRKLAPKQHNNTILPFSITLHALMCVYMCVIMWPGCMRRVYTSTPGKQSSYTQPVSQTVSQSEDQETMNRTACLLQTLSNTETLITK